MQDAAATATPYRNVEDGLAAAQDALDRGDLSSALGIYSELRRRFPAYPEPFKRAAAALLDAGHFDEADLLLEFAQARFSTDPTISADHARVALRRGDLPEALRRWEQTRITFADDPAGYVGGITTLRTAHQFEAAADLLREVQGRFSNDRGLLLQQAWLAHETGHHADAIQHFITARQQGPDEPDAMLGLSRALAAVGRFDEAEALLRDGVARFGQIAALSEDLASLPERRAAWSEPPPPQPVAVSPPRQPDVTSPAVAAPPPAQPEPPPREASPQRVSLDEFAVSHETLLDSTEFHAPACIAYTNFPLLEPVTGAQHVNQLYVAGTHKLDAVTLGRLPSATELIVAGHEDFVPFHDGRVLDVQVPPYWDEAAVPGILAASRPRVEIDGSAVLIARYGLRTWGHWLAELLPKMVCVEAAFPGKHRFVLPASVFSDPILRPLLESVWYHGIDLARIVPVQPDTVYRFSELYAVDPVWSRHKIHPGAAGLLRARMKPAGHAMPRKVAFLRTESETRNIANAAAVTGDLKQQGFTMVEIGSLPFADQVATFAAAETVVSVLGSGLSGLLYAPSGVNVLTLAPSRWLDLFFFALMQNRDAHLADIRGPQDPADPRDAAVARFVVERQEIRLGLRALGL